MKKIVTVIMALLLVISNFAVVPWKVEAASHLIINGKDIGYAPKDYFSETGKQCTCHGKGICAPQRKGCVCKHVSGTAQCYAFALWCEEKMFGYNDVSKSSKFKSVGSISGKVNKDSIKKLISKTPIGAHIRTGGSAHSMILMSKNDKGFTVAQANGGNNNEYSGYYKCRIGTATYTWSGYAKSSYGSRGIQFVKVPKDMHVKPDAPTITSCKLTGNAGTTVEIAWKQASGAEKYKITRHEKNWGNPQTFYTTGTKYTDKGLKAGTAYFYTVYAVSGNEISSRSLISKIYTKPSAPKGLAVKQDSESQLTVSWNKVSGASKYKVLFHEAGKSWGVLKNNWSANSYTHKGLKAGKKYYYRVVAMCVDEMGLEGKRSTKTVESAQSETKAGFTKMEQPSNHVDGKLTDVVLKWDAAQGDANKTYVYNVYRDGGSKPVNETYVTGTSYTDSTATSGKIHKYRMEIVENSGSVYTAQGGSDNFYAGSTIAKEKISVTPESETSMRISWDTPSSAPGGIKYVIIRDDEKGSVKCGETDKTYYIDEGLTSGETYQYHMQVMDVSDVCLAETEKKSAKLELSAEEKKHTYSKEPQIIKQATCKEEGEQARVCEDEGCEEKTDIQVIGKTAHTFSDTWEISKGTCTEAGIRYRECTVCGARETETIDAASHEYELTEQTEPTLDGPGTRTYTCRICKDVYTEEWVNVVNEGEISVGGAAADVGETVKIPVTITDNPGIAGFTFQVNYDKSVLTPTAVTAGELLEKDGKVMGTFTSNLDQGISASELDQVTVHWTNNAGIVEDGVLFYIDFTVGSDAAKSSYPIWITYEDGNIVNQKMEEIKPNILDNVITIADVIRGDVNLDRSVNVSDGIMLARYLAKWNITLNDRQLEAADVYKDSKVNVKDGVRLAQILAGYADAEEAGTAKARTFFAPAGQKSVPRIAVENFEAAAGDTVYLPVIIDDNPGIAGFDLEFTYDSSYLTPVSVEKGDLLEEGDFSSNLDEGEGSGNGDAIAVHWSNVGNVAENGQLFAIEFAIKEDAELGKMLPVEISSIQDMVCDKDLNSVTVSLEQGGVETAAHSEDIVEPHDFDVYKIEDVSMKLSGGAVCEEIPANGDFSVTVSLDSTAEEFYPAQLVAAAYDTNGALLEMTSGTITEEMLPGETLPGSPWSLHMGKTTAKIAKIKVFVWDSAHNMAPLAEPAAISR